MYNKKIILILTALLLTGCASMHYSKTKVGTLSGRLTVQWINPDQFRFVPDSDQPLSFTRHNSATIVPGEMFTDGGSIPRPLWAIKNYSPWGYAPAFIVHDWLFEMNHCSLDGAEAYDVHEAATVMSEVIKTLMVSDANVETNKFVLYSMHQAVSSAIAQEVWESGACDLVVPQETATESTEPEVAPIKEMVMPVMEYTIEFP